MYVNKSGGVQYLNESGGSSSKQQPIETELKNDRQRLDNTAPRNCQISLHGLDNLPFIDKVEDERRWQALKQAMTTSMGAATQNPTLPAVLQLPGIGDTIQGYLDIPSLMALAQTGKGLRSYLKDYEVVAAGITTEVERSMKGFNRQVNRFHKFAPPAARQTTLTNLAKAMNLAAGVSDIDVMHQLLNFVPALPKGRDAEQDVQLKATNLLRGLVMAGHIQGADIKDKIRFAHLACDVVRQLPRNSHSHTAKGVASSVLERTKRDFFSGTVHKSTFGLLLVPAAALAAVTLPPRLLAAATHSDKTVSKGLGLLTKVIASIPANQMPDELVADVKDILTAPPSWAGDHRRELHRVLRNHTTPAQRTALANDLRAAGRNYW